MTRPLAERIVDAARQTLPVPGADVSRRLLAADLQLLHDIDAQIAVIVRSWDQVGDAAGLTIPERRLLWRRQFLNPYCLENYPLGIAIPER